VELAELPKRDVGNPLKLSIVFAAVEFRGITADKTLYHRLIV
jgi:hypothetical protein